MAERTEFNEGWFKKSYSPVFADREADWLQYKKVAKFAGSGLPRNSYVLEVGCGLGTLSYRLSEYSEHVMGVDISGYACSQARALYGHKKITFIVADAQRLPFKSEKFDGVVVSHIFSCLDDAVAAEVQKEIYRILKRGGRLITEQPAHGKESIVDVAILSLLSSGRNRRLYYYTRKAIRLARKQNPQTDFHHLAGIGNPLHKRIYDVRLLVQELTKAGFTKFEFPCRKLFSILFLNSRFLFKGYVRFYLKAPEMIRRLFLISIGSRVRAIKL